MSPAHASRMEPLLDSSDMGPNEWVELASMIERDYYDFDGFVIIMGTHCVRLMRIKPEPWFHAGTDTMAYCASALSFIFENLGKPVICTGSMIPLASLMNVRESVRGRLCQLTGCF